MPHGDFDLDRVKCHAATPSRWADLEKLFGEHGACAGCWCMFLRLPRKAWDQGRGDGNRKALERIVTSGARPGVLAYYGREPIGWCAVAPRAEYVALARSRRLKPVDDRPVWSVTCFFVAKPHRRAGVSVRLLEAAVELAARQGARIVEGYPSVPKTSRTADPFVWRGTPATFERAGFLEVARPSPAGRIMRRLL
jgi:GNAT superfamily N-acetyltransferase